jgi:hypothetical protein
MMNKKIFVVINGHLIAEKTIDAKITRGMKQKIAICRFLDGSSALDVLADVFGVLAVETLQFRVVFAIAFVDEIGRRIRIERATAREFAAFFNPGTRFENWVRKQNSIIKK